jgi:hypothetical protein
LKLPPPPHCSKRPSTKKMTAFDRPVNIISNAFNPKHLDVFFCWKKKIFMFSIASLVFPMCLLNTPFTTCYPVAPCQHSCFLFSFIFGHPWCYLDVFLLLTNLRSFLNQNITLSWILTRNVQNLKMFVKLASCLKNFQELSLNNNQD